MNPFTLPGRLASDARSVWQLMSRLPRLAKVRIRVREMLAHGGMVVATPDDGAAYARTMVQLDGDTLTSFRADAVADPQKIKTHYDRVNRAMSDLQCLPAVAGALAAFGTSLAAAVIGGLYLMDQAASDASFWQTLIHGWAKYGAVTFVLPRLLRKAGPRVLEWLLIRGRTPFAKPEMDGLG